MGLRELVIFGAGDFASVARAYFSADSGYQVAAFTVDRERLEITALDGLPVVPFETVEREYPPARFAMFVAVGFNGMNKARAAICARAKQKGYTLASYVSSRAVVGPELACGENCFILENNVVQPFVRIGADVVLWSGNHIGHHVEIGDHCFISSQVVLSGRVRVGAYSFLGVNACVKQGVIIAPECFIGAGAVILKDTRPEEVYIVKSTPPMPLRSSQLEGML
jgi:sugar O-acyltransferase (sialic acid O-acetyltransferase NeuD family)